MPHARLSARSCVLTSELGRGLTAALRTANIGSMISIDNPVGRLCVARFVPPLDIAQIDQLALDIRKYLGRFQRAAIFGSDTRRVQVLLPEVADRITAMLRSDNPRVERSAVVIGKSSVFGLQIERIFREAGNPGRKVFRSVEAMTTWLDESLTPAERLRMRSFLDEDRVE